MSPKPLEDYATVAERIQQFYERFPEGSLTANGEPRLFHVGERTYIAYSALAFRTPDDQRPGLGWAWEPVPGPTPFTHDSELQNAETAAWGRAIVALGFETKKGIASREEVEARQEQPQLSKQTRSAIIGLLGSLGDNYPPPESSDDWFDAARRVIAATWNVDGIGQLSEAQGKELLARLREKRRELQEQARMEDEIPWPEPNEYDTGGAPGQFEPPQGRRGGGGE